MDFSVYKLVVRYDGTDFSGFQRLSGAPQLRTIQGTLEEALSQIADHPVNIHTAGRTDAGVHAKAQVISFKCYSRRRPQSFCEGVNGILPRDLKVLSAQIAPPTFHARYSALSRSYEYLLWPTDSHSVFFDTRISRVSPQLEVPKMQAAAQLLLGTHDFTSYGAKVPKGISRVKTLQELSVCEDYICGPGCFGELGRVIVVRAKASGFLRRMVRMLTTALVKVGKGEWSVEQPYELLAKLDPYYCPPPVAPGGLYFVGAEYPQE